MTTPRYSVVVPVFNEAENIGTFCRRATTELPPDCELLICYDFEGDNTLPALRALPEADKPKALRLIHNTLGRGVRFAIEAGMRAAEAPVVLVMMADLSDDFSKVAEMIGRVEAGADVVCASRYMRGGRQIGGPRFKGFLSRAAGVSLYWLAGLPTHDPTNSFKAYSKTFLQRTPIESTAGFCLGMELTVKAHFEGGRVEEVPATWHDRAVGQSRFQLGKWLPLYLHWYSWAFDRSRRANALAVTLLILLGLFAAVARLALRPDFDYSANFVVFEEGNQMYRADRLNHGALLYRDVACQYGPLPVYLHAFVVRLAGNTISTNLAFHIAGSLVCVALSFFVLRKALGLFLAFSVTLVAGFPVLLMVGGLVGGANMEYVALERMCLLVIMLLWQPPDLRSPSRSLWLGLVFGLWQLVKFGGAFFGGAALLAVDALVLRGHRDLWRALLSWSLIGAAFALVEGTGVAAAFALLPSDLAFETVWPAYMQDGYTAFGKRWPHWNGIFFFFAMQWLPLGCAALGVAALAYWLWRSVSAAGVTNRERANFHLGIGLLFYGIGAAKYIAHGQMFYQYSWTLIFPAAWALTMVCVRWQLRLGVIAAPAFLLMLRITFASSLPPTVVDFVLPDGQTLPVEEAQADELRHLARIADRLRGKPEEFFVALFAWGGGGLHWQFNAHYDLRNYMVVAHGFRPYDDEELSAKLRRVTGFVVKLEGVASTELEEAGTTKIRSALSPELASTIFEGYRYDPELSGGRFAVFIRRGQH